jgi:hypothetical protein
VREWDRHDSGKLYQKGSLPRGKIYGDRKLLPPRARGKHRFICEYGIDDSLHNFHRVFANEQRAISMHSSFCDPA